ncbi:hypothetical protein AUJ93_02980 [bacterium CG2_30_33_46]|nr:MAG: hypothetical protein AUJ93_02980 [bacterium CG2_30_33_46]
MFFGFLLQGIDLFTSSSIHINWIISLFLVAIFIVSLLIVFEYKNKKRKNERFLDGDVLQKSKTNN